MPDMPMASSLRHGVAWCGVSARGHMARPTPIRDLNAMPGLTRMTASVATISGGHAGGLSRPLRAPLAAPGQAARRSEFMAANSRPAP